MKKHILTCLLLYVGGLTFAQEAGYYEDDDDESRVGVRYSVEAQSTVSDGKTPLWLNANKYGLSSLDESNGYLRVGLSRSSDENMERRWGLGYGLDVAVPYHFTSKFVIQQVFVEARWLSGTLTVGSKQYPMELKNNELSSGSQTLGINARPVPQARIALPEYWTLPMAHGWLHFKGHLAYGKTTDDRWQHDFTGRRNSYADDVLYHSKAGYIKIGNEEFFIPFSVELGLEMASTFGGTAYVADGEGGLRTVTGKTGLGAYWNAFVPGGSDSGETTYQNVEGNHVGSWLLRLNWDTETWRFSLYGDKYFEDHSAMFHLDYDGYGQGEDWKERKKNRYLLYDFKDIMLGAELNVKYGRWISDVVVEYIYSKYQSGPIYHDHTSAIPDHIGGKDNFYNHYIYTGWQHWGQVIGNPLYRSPIYNEDGRIDVENNRFMAFHVGIGGHPSDNLSYRVLASWQEGLGTYDNPYDKKLENVSLLAEATYSFDEGRLRGWSVRGGLGLDFGKILGNNKGFQLTLSRTGIIKVKQSRKK